MKHISPIKVLTKHIEKLQIELKKEEEIIDNPELMASYHLAFSAAANIEQEINAMTAAINVLIKD